MKHLYFVRHGLSVLNQQGLWSGSTDTPLTDEGKAQARAAGKRAKQLSIDIIVASPLKRAHDTAKIIASEIAYPHSEIVLHDLLTERHFGVLEGTPYDPSLAQDNVEDIETLEALRARVEQLWEHLQTLDHDTVLVVSHGSTGRMLRTIIHPETPFWSDDPDLREKLKFPNAEIVKLV